MVGWMKEKNEYRPILFTLHKTQLHMYQRPQHKTRYIQSDRREGGSSLELSGKRKTFWKEHWWHSTKINKLYVGVHKAENFLYDKGRHLSSKTTALQNWAKYSSDKYWNHIFMKRHWASNKYNFKQKPIDHKHAMSYTYLASI